MSWVIDEKQRKQFEEEIFGKRLLITNREEWSTEEIIKGYHGQGYIEETFRQSKDDEHFAIRPQYHWTDQKIRVHVFICLLALMVGRILERKARVLGRKECLSSLIEKLSSIRLALVLKGGKRGKRFADASWILEKCPENLSSMFRQLVPNKEPFVYTPNFYLKGFHK